jgi:hypothetical protein
LGLREEGMGSRSSSRIGDTRRFVFGRDDFEVMPEISWVHAFDMGVVARGEV